MSCTHKAVRKQKGWVRRKDEHRVARKKPGYGDISIDGKHVGYCIGARIVLNNPSAKGFRVPNSCLVNLSGVEVVNIRLAFLGDRA